MDIQEKIETLEQFKSDLNEWEASWKDTKRRSELRSQINQNKVWVRQQVIESGCFVTITVGPPPAIGGFVMHDIDPFDMIFDPPYGKNLRPLVTDMIDQTIGVIKTTPEK